MLLVDDEDNSWQKRENLSSSSIEKRVFLIDKNKWQNKDTLNWGKPHQWITLKMSTKRRRAEVEVEKRGGSGKKIEKKLWNYLNWS